MRSLTEAQAKMLARYGREPGEGWLTNTWIAESCGHYANPGWAARKIRSLAERGYVEIGGGGYSRITDAGRLALAEQEKRDA